MFAIGASSVLYCVAIGGCSVQMSLVYLIACFIGGCSMFMKYHIVCSIALVVVLYYVVCYIVSTVFVLYCVYHQWVFCRILCVPLVGVPYCIVFHWFVLCAILCVPLVGALFLYFVSSVGVVYYIVCHWWVFHCFLVLRWRHPRRLAHLLTIGEIATVLYSFSVENYIVQCVNE